MFRCTSVYICGPPSMNHVNHHSRSSPPPICFYFQLIFFLSEPRPLRSQHWLSNSLIYHLHVKVGLAQPRQFLSFRDSPWVVEVRQWDFKWDNKGALVENLLRHDLAQLMNPLSWPLCSIKGLHSYIWKEHLDHSSALNRSHTTWALSLYIQQSSWHLGPIQRTY